MGPKNQKNQFDKARKTDLYQRVLAIKHKLKVHDSLPPPDTHEELSEFTVSRWELEDELVAIEEILRDARAENIANKKNQILENGPKKKSIK